MPYRELDHTADAGVVVEGSSAEETLARLVLAFADVVTGGGEVSEDGELTVAADPGEYALMAVDVLRELLFRLESESRVPTSVCVVHFDPERGTELRIGTGPFDPATHAEGLVLKAVTLHEARFEPASGAWVAQVVFDV